MWQFNSPDYSFKTFITIHNECPLELGHMVMNAVALFYDCNDDCEDDFDDL